MFKHILVPLDGSYLAECVLAHVNLIARALESRITIMHVLNLQPSKDPIQAVNPLDWHMSRIKADSYLKGIVSRLQDAGLDVQSVLEEGQAAENIIAYAEHHNVDLLALSSHGQSGLSGWNVSSVVQKIIHRAYKSTLLVRAYKPATKELSGLRYRRIFIPIDCSPRADCVLPLATSMARFHGTKLIVGNVVSKPEIISRVPLGFEEIALADEFCKRNKETAAHYLEQLHSQFTIAGIDIRIIQRTGITAPAVLHEMVNQEMPDLVILSAHGSTGDTRWPYGSVTTGFIAYGSTPLIIVQDISRTDTIPTPAEKATIEHKGH